MENLKENSGIFEDKKKTARIMRNVFIVVAVVYVGLIIWSLCRQNYVPALFDVAILLMDIGYVYWCNALISDADLAISAIECERSRCDLIDTISRNHPWISVEERLPEKARGLYELEEDEQHKTVLFKTATGKLFIGYLDAEEIWRAFTVPFKGAYIIDSLTWSEVTHWMPISEVPQS